MPPIVSFVSKLEAAAVPAAAATPKPPYLMLRFETESLVSSFALRSRADDNSCPMLPDLDHITSDVPCHHCGRNLRGLLPDGQCPGCNERITTALATRRRRPADHPELAQIDRLLMAVAARNSQSTCEHVAFVIDVVQFALYRTENAAAALDIWAAAVDVAFASAGSGAVTWLAARGLDTGSDLGRLVFALANVHLVTLHSDDRIEEFSALPPAQLLVQQCLPMNTDPVENALPIEYRLRCRCLRNLRSLKAGDDCPRCGGPVGRSIFRVWKRTQRESLRVHKRERCLRALMLDIQRTAAFRAGMAERAARIAWSGIYDAQCLRWHAHFGLPLSLSAELIQSSILMKAFSQHGLLTVQFLDGVGLRTGADIARLAGALVDVGLAARQVKTADFSRLPNMAALYERANQPKSQSKDLLTITRELSNG